MSSPPSIVPPSNAPTIVEMPIDPAAADRLQLADIDGLLAILVSGGLDSAILVGDVLRANRTVQPLYVRSGLYWESVELEYLRRYLGALRTSGLRPLHILDL